jgi:hypothetical protein
MITRVKVSAFPSIFRIEKSFFSDVMVDDQRKSVPKTFSQDFPKDVRLSCSNKFLFSPQIDQFERLKKLIWIYLIKCLA